MENSDISPAAEPAPATPSQALALAIQAMHKAQMAGEADAATAALLDAMAAFGVVTSAKYTDGLPQHDVDYSLVMSEQGISIQSLTAKGEMLCALWDSYTSDLEKQALQTRVMQLSHHAQKTEERLTALQRQLDNAMMDFNAIRRKLKA